MIAENAFNGKVFSLVLKNQSTGLLLLVTGPDGELKLFKIDTGRRELIFLSTFLLPHSKQRWMTDFLVVNDFERAIESENNSLLCGDRRGSLHLFKTFKQVPISYNKNTAINCLIQKNNGSIFIAM